MDPLQSFRLDAKVAVVTGASSGLGVGFARTLAAAGAHVVLAARRADRLEQVAAQIRADLDEQWPRRDDRAMPQVLTRVTDVADPGQCQALAAHCVEQLGRIDVLVNNAGLGGATPASRETEAAFRRVLDVNLCGTFWMAQACAPSMPPGSSIVNISSMLAHIAPRFPQASYAASKAGVLGLTRDLAQQWSGRKGIRVNALCPGYFSSEMTERDGEVLRELVSTQSMLGRFGEQHEIDAALLFLASPASAYMTGQSLVVDGGMAAL